MGTATQSVRPTTRGHATRARILDVAEDAVPAKGFDAPSIEELVAGAGITRGVVMAKVLREPQALARQVLLQRSYVKLPFSPA